MEIKTINSWDNPAADEITRRLKDFNASQGFTSEAEYMTVAAMNGDKLLGGATIMAKWNWVYCEYLYVIDKRKGTGAKIMAEVENIARAKSKIGVYLYTNESQTPSFYESLGYVETARIPDFLGTNAELLMIKKLT